jgi:DNA repair exonuclease SbcCD nuclease subunit
MLVTSDLHLGLNLYNKKHNFEVFRRLNYLTKLSRNKYKCPIIVAGDIVHSKNPNSFIYSQFYKFLKRNKDVKYIFIPGNHDGDFLDPCHYIGLNNVVVFDKIGNLELNNINYIFIHYLKKRVLDGLTFDEYVKKELFNIDLNKNIIIITHTQLPGCQVGFEQILEGECNFNFLSNLNESGKKIISGHIQIR